MQTNGSAHPTDLDALHATITSDVQADTSDPSLSPAAVALDRMKSLVAEMSRGGLGNLTELRDALDDLMRATKQRAHQLTHDFEEFANMVESAVAMKAVIMPPIQELSEKVGASLTPKSGRTITHN